MVLSCAAKTAQSFPGQFSTESTVDWRLAFTSTGRSAQTRQSLGSEQNTVPTETLPLGCVFVLVTFCVSTSSVCSLVLFSRTHHFVVEYLSVFIDWKPFRKSSSNNSKMFTLNYKASPQ